MEIMMMIMGIIIRIWQKKNLKNFNVSKID